MKKSAIIGVMILSTVIFFIIIGVGVHSSANDNTKDLQLLHVVSVFSITNLKVGSYQSKFVIN